jgi:gamma-glutamyltranspeptidase/glutathione hydrolase
MLGMIERFDIKALGPDSPVAWHLIAEAMGLGYADREKYLGDPGFVKVPVAGLLDPAYVKSRSALISEKTSLPKYEAGTPPGAEARTAALSSEVAGTTHFVAVDSAGNVASMTSTVEGPFGSQLIAEGFVLNNELTDFTFAPVKDGAPVANAVAAGKRPLSSMSPTIVLDPSPDSELMREEIFGPVLPVITVAMTELVSVNSRAPSVSEMHTLGSQSPAVTNVPAKGPKTLL